MNIHTLPATFLHRHIRKRREFHTIIGGRTNQSVLYLTYWGDTHIPHFCFPFKFQPSNTASTGTRYPHLINIKHQHAVISGRH